MNFNLYNNNILMAHLYHDRTVWQNKRYAGSVDANVLQYPAQLLLARALFTDLQTFELTTIIMASS